MRKYLLVFSIFIILTFLSGCNNTFENNKLIPNSNNIIITKHLGNSPTDITITIDNEEIVNYIVNNFNSLKVEEMDYIKPHGIMYTLKFYNDLNEVKQIEVISSKYLAISDSISPYFIKKGELDLDYIEKLFNDLALDDPLEQLIINAYIKKYLVHYFNDMIIMYITSLKKCKTLSNYLHDEKVSWRKAMK